MKLLKTGEIHTECAGINRHGVAAAMRTFGFGPVAPGRGQALVNRTKSLYVPEHSIDALLGLALKLSDGVVLTVFPAGRYNESWRLIDFEKLREM